MTKVKHKGRRCTFWIALLWTIQMSRKVFPLTDQKFRVRYVGKTLRDIWIVQRSAVQNVHLREALDRSLPWAENCHQIIKEGRALDWKLGHWSHQPTLVRILRFYKFASGQKGIGVEVVESLGCYSTRILPNQVKDPQRHQRRISFVQPRAAGATKTLIEERVGCWKTTDLGRVWLDWRWRGLKLKGFGVPVLVVESFWRYDLNLLN